jgi:hypothetical protein
MQWEEWKFSARRASQDFFIRWVTVTAFLILIGMTIFFLKRLLPEGWRSGVVTLHYNVYLGIDDVRPWWWLFFIPGAAGGLFLMDVLLAASLFRMNALASRTILAIGAASLLVWAVGCFFLIRVNV